MLFLPSTSFILSFILSRFPYQRMFICSSVVANSLKECYILSPQVLNSYFPSNSVQLNFCFLNENTLDNVTSDFHIAKPHMDFSILIISLILAIMFASLHFLPIPSSNSFFIWFLEHNNLTFCLPCQLSFFLPSLLQVECSSLVLVLNAHLLPSSRLLITI